MTTPVTTTSIVDPTVNTPAKPIGDIPVAKKKDNKAKLFFKKVGNSFKKEAFQRRHASFKQILPYIKLQTVLSFKSTRVQKKASKIIGWILKGLVFALAYLFLFAFIRSLTHQTTFVTGQMCLIVFFTLAQIILLVYSVSLQIKRLYKPNDLRIISTFPMTSFQRYLGEIIAIYLKLAIMSAIFFFPLLMVYGGAARLNLGTELKPIFVECYFAKYPAQYLFSSIFATILLPLFPFALSLVISVPFMFLSDFLQNKHIAKLVIFIVVFVAILVLYALVLDFMADSYIRTKTSQQVMKGIKNFLLKLNHWYNPAYFVSEICIFTHVGANFGILCAMVFVFGLAGILITKPLYHKFTTHGVIEGDASVRKQKKDKKEKAHTNAYLSIFTKEFKEILRTPAYAYFYLGVAFSMPVMTYLITNLVTKLGQAQVGSSVFFGFGMLTLFVIISLIGAYAGSVVSREGKQFYITKMIPLSYRKQLFAKALVNFTVAFGGLLLCTIVLGATSMKTNSNPDGLTWGNLFLLFGTSTFFLIGVTFNGVNLDVSKPRIDMLGGNINETNILIQLIIGLVISAFITLIVITVDSVAKKYTVYVHLGAMFLMIVYALTNFLIFFFRSEKKYREIELK